MAEILCRRDDGNVYPRRLQELFAFREECTSAMVAIIVCVAERLHSGRGVVAQSQTPGECRFDFFRFAIARVAPMVGAMKKSSSATQSADSKQRFNHNHAKLRAPIPSAGV
jgi:hypothetical protein